LARRIGAVTDLEKKSPPKLGGRDALNVSMSITIRRIVGQYRRAVDTRMRIVSPTNIKRTTADFDSTGNTPSIDGHEPLLVYDRPHFQENSNIYKRTSAGGAADLRKFPKIFSLRAACRPIGV
jgi:hypothetical protein